MYLPSHITTSTEISIITGEVQQYNASGTLTGYEVQVYIVPFFIWIVLVIPAILIILRIIKEFIKRW